MVARRNYLQDPSRTGVRTGRWSAFAVLLGVGLFALAPSARAVIIDSGDGTGNTSAPPDDPGWVYVGTRSDLTAVYIGGGWVLTANHVPLGTVIIDGVIYAPIVGSDVQLSNGDGTFADLKIFAIAGDPGLADLPIRSDALTVGTALMMIGQGRDRGAFTTWDPGAPNAPISGYEWLNTRSRRWGTNHIDGIPSSRILNTVSFFARFDAGQPDHEAQVVQGDSGGAVFIKNGGVWELAGIQFARSEFMGQPMDTALYGNFSYASDLSFYRDEILDVIAAPEPGLSLQIACGGLGVWMLDCRRRRDPHSTPP